MASKTVITDAGMKLMSNSTASTGSQYWIGFYSLAYVPWKDGTVDEPEVGTTMTRLTTYGDEIYNVFQGDLTSEGFAGVAANFGYTHYDGNLLRNYRYVRRADGRNALVTWVNSGTKSISGAVVYSGATQTSDSSGNVVNVTSGIPLPAPLYYMNSRESASADADFVSGLTYPVADTSVLSDLNRLTSSSGASIPLPMISTDFRDYAAHGTSVTDPTAHSEFYSSPLTEDYTWYSSTATRTEDSDSTYSNQWNRYCDEFWKLQSISRYNRYHSPVNSNGIIVNYDTACRNMSKVTKYFPIDSYSVSGSKKVGEHEYATAIRLGIHLDVSRSMTAAETENYFDLAQSGTSSILDMSGKDLFQSNSVSFKFNRIGVYAVPVRQVAYRNAEEITKVKAEYQIDTDAEPVLFAVIDFDSAEIMSNDGDGNVTFEAELEVNLRAASDDSSVIRDTAVFYNRLEDDAGNWYKNQLIANASICEAVTQQGIAIGHLAQTVGNSGSSQSGSGKCCNDSNNYSYASKNHTHKFLINFEDGAVVNDYGVRGRATATEGKPIPAAINPVQITSVNDTVTAEKTYSVYHDGSLLWMTGGYDGDGQNPSASHYYRYNPTYSTFPSGWRLPTKDEFYGLIDEIKTTYGLSSRELALPYVLSAGDWTGLTAYGNTLAIQPNGYAKSAMGELVVYNVGTSVTLQTSDSDKPLITISYADGALTISEADYPAGTIAMFYYTSVLVKAAETISDLTGTYMLGKYSFCYGDGTLCAGDLSTVSGKDNYVSAKCSRVDVSASTGTRVYDSYLGSGFWGIRHNTVKKTSSYGVLVSGCDDCYFDTVGYSAFIGCRNTDAYDVETSLILGLGYSGVNPGSVRNIHSMIVVGDYSGNTVHDCSGGFVVGDKNTVSHAGRSIVSGDSNTLSYMGDCAVSGGSNTLSYIGDCAVSGNHNTLTYIGQCVVSGSFNTLTSLGQCVSLGYGNTYRGCGQSVLGGYYMQIAGSAEGMGGIGASLVLGGYVTVIGLESSVVSIGGSGYGLSPMTSAYPISGDPSGSEYITFYTVSSTPSTVGGITYYPNPYGDDSGNYIRGIHGVKYSLLLGSSMYVGDGVDYISAIGNSLYIHGTVKYCAVVASRSNIGFTTTYSDILGDALYIGQSVSYCMISANYSVINSTDAHTYGIISGSYIKMTSGAAYLLAQGSYLYVGDSSYYTAVFGTNNTVTNGSKYSFIFGSNNIITNGSNTNAVIGDYASLSSGSYNFIVGSCDYLSGSAGNSYVSVNGAVIGSYVSVPLHSGYSHLVVGTDWNKSGVANAAYGDAFLSTDVNNGGGRISTGTIQLGRGLEYGGLVLGGSTSPKVGQVLGVVGVNGRLASVDWISGGTGTLSCEYLCQSVKTGPADTHSIITQDNWSSSTYVNSVMRSSGYTPSSDSAYVSIAVGTYRVDWSLACQFSCYVYTYSNVGSLTFFGVNMNTNGFTYGNSGSFIISASAASNLCIDAVSPGGVSGVFSGSSVFITKLS